MKTLFTTLDSGRIFCPSGNTDAGDRVWNQHPDFAGVALKHLVSGKDTGGKFSVHLVRLEPGSCIGDHVHEVSWELHEVADGSGQCILNGRTIDYEPGVVAIMPENELHSVRAGENGLCLLAKFVPALV